MNSLLHWYSQSKNYFRFNLLDVAGVAGYYFDIPHDMDTRYYLVELKSGMFQIVIFDTDSTGTWGSAYVTVSADGFLDYLENNFDHYMVDSLTHQFNHYMSKKSMTVRDVLNKQRESRERIGHLRYVTSILSTWIKVAHQEGYA